MTDVIYDYISMGIDMLVSAAVLASVIILLRSSSILSNVTAMQQANSDRINYYRQFNAFDNKEVNQADVVGLLLYYRNDMNIAVVKKDDHSRVCWTTTNDAKIHGANPDGYDSTNISDALALDGKYHAYLIEDRATVSLDGEGMWNAKVDSFQGGIVTGIVIEYQAP